LFPCLPELLEMLQNSFARLRFIAATGIVCVLGVVLQEWRAPVLSTTVMRVSLG